MEVAILILLLAAIALLVILLLRKQEKPADDTLKSDILSGVKALEEVSLTAVRQIGGVLSDSQKTASDNQTKLIRAMNEKLNSEQQSLSLAVNKQLELIQNTLTNQTNQIDIRMKALREENNQKLEEIRGTVNEKLQTTLEKRIAESFKSVSEQLANVYEGLGEMRNLAADVGGLKNVLSGVKTRGILGEIQLGSIIEEILTPDQYETNVATIPGSSERVEFAVKLPGSDGQYVYLPIDSKFPGDTYSTLVDARQSGDKAAIERASKELAIVVKKEAKDIKDKYISVPYTTNFGLMFLPFEGLYAEVVNSGLMDVLRRDYQVNVAGPSTMAALLNSFQMGFRTLAIQKRSNEVWMVLGAVKTEFDKFEDVLKKMQNHLNQTSSDLDTIIGTRTKAINRKLRNIQQLEPADSEKILALDNNPDTEED